MTVYLDGLRAGEDMPCDLWGFCSSDCRKACLANARATAATQAETARKAKLPCPHEEFTVRISRHSEDWTGDCSAPGPLSGYTCGRPECKARLMALVQCKTGCSPVATKIPDEMQTALKEVPF